MHPSGYPPVHYTEIRPEHVGCETFWAFGAWWLVSDFRGRQFLLTSDIGKRVFRCGDVVAIETSQQRDKRTEQSR